MTRLSYIYLTRVVEKEKKTKQNTLRERERERERGVLSRVRQNKFKPFEVHVHFFIPSKYQKTRG